MKILRDDRRTDLADEDIPDNVWKDTSGDLAVDMGKENLKITPKANRINMTARDSWAAEERDASAERVSYSVHVTQN